MHVLAGKIVWRRWYKLVRKTRLELCSKLTCWGIPLQNMALSMLIPMQASSLEIYQTQAEVKLLLGEESYYSWCRNVGPGGSLWANINRYRIRGGDFGDESELRYGGRSRVKTLGQKDGYDNYSFYAMQYMSLTVYIPLWSIITKVSPK